jgi:hypothetical protein
MWDKLNEAKEPRNLGGFIQGADMKTPPSEEGGVRIAVDL